MFRLVLGPLALLGMTGWASAQPPERSDLRVLYVGPAASPRGQAYAKFLGEQFRHAATAERDGFDPRRADAFDVVLLDWSQDERDAAPPLGPKEKWSRPTVLLGSAGLLMAQAWEVHGAIG
jgi:hypothetical protein